MHIRLILSGALEDHNSLRINIQESLQAFHPKNQVWKAKLQTFPEPSKVGLIMYSANTLQVNLLVNNVLSVIKQEKDLDIEVAIQSEVAFLTKRRQKGIIFLL